MVKAKTTRRRARGTGGRSAPGDAAKGVMKLRSAAPEAPPSPLEMAPRAHAVPHAERLNLGRMVETNGGSCLESVPGFDAARARTRGLLSPAVAVGSPLAESADADGYAMENRAEAAPVPVAVPDTTAIPWRCIAMLSITYENGSSATGTAWFLGERALGTAGHNIRHPRHGKATQIVVSPGYDGRGFPLGSYVVEETHCDPAWLGGDDDPTLDFGVLVVGETIVGRRLGWFGLAAYEDRRLDKMMLNISGYPANRRVRTQYFSGGRLERSDPLFLQYGFDTSGGMSGAPIFALFDEQRVAVGIHTSALTGTNRARRIDAGLYDFLNRFTAL